ncbi:MAG TPA: hypothetical protein VG860_21805 [Terriglobia bacterium]|jgi:hypothetical protein|nr:hypothetical protein [Terriglobia bacterium]
MKIKSLKTIAAKIMTMKNRPAGVLAALVLMMAGLGSGPGRATAFPAQGQSGAAQGQSDPSSAGSKKAAPAKTKSSNKELSEEQGGARGFQLPGDGSDQAASAAKKPTPAHKAAKKTTPDQSPKQQP